MNQSNYLTVKTTITQIEPHIDKNNNCYFRLSVRWDQNNRTFYAFATDFNLKDTTFATLNNAPENFINRLVLITYQEQTHKNGNGVFYKVKEIEIVR
jgi:hypothetical protein